MKESLIAMGGLDKVVTEQQPVPSYQDYRADEAPGRTIQDVYALKESAPLLRSISPEMSVRSILLTHIGGRMSEVMITAACNRVHSHRQRLARWLLIATDKAGRRSLDVTHETLAQLVGGPRHAVTVALNELRGKGAIAHLRGRLEIVQRSILVDQACECYRQPGKRSRHPSERRH